ncbi:MAG: survival protein SurE [Acidimicrobiia bacterium]|nr:survival protein SurE [Acidimicrobiia bacterium]
MVNDRIRGPKASYSARVGPPARDSQPPTSGAEMSRHRHVGALAAALVALILTGLSAAPVGAEHAAKKKGVAPLRVLVTNDDGVGAEGIDVLVEALRLEPKLKITVVAPADNQTLASDKTSPGPLVATETTLLGGFKATAVQGFPADSVNYALDELGLKPHVVIAGINNGQNLGGTIAESGTVGAARTAVRRGIPAVAISQGLGAAPDYATGADEAIKWLRKNRKAIAKAKGRGATTAATFNVPTCVVGAVREVLEDIPISTGRSAEGENDVHCDSTLTDPVDDIEAFNNGFVTLNHVPAG